MMSLMELHRSGRIWWIRSLPTLRKWVRKDLEGNNYLQPIIVKGKKYDRYYFNPENVEKYVRAFEKMQV